MRLEGFRLFDLCVKIDDASLGGRFRGIVECVQAKMIMFVRES